MIERIVLEVGLQDTETLVNALRGYARLNTYHATAEYKWCRNMADIFERALDDALEINRLEQEETDKTAALAAVPVNPAGRISTEGSQL